jgi:hypothetical protein
MRLGRAGLVALVLWVSSLGGSGCTPIVELPASDAPLNRCPEHACELYAPGAVTAPTCREEGFCEIATAGGRPQSEFWVLVHVPDTSFFAPGSTYVLYANERGEPAFTSPVKPGVSTSCVAPKCLVLGGLSAMFGAYQVHDDASAYVGYPLANLTSVPVRVEYEPTGNDQEDTFPSLPLDVLFDSSRLVIGDPLKVRHTRAVPFGRYTRILYPQPPFDAYFPPTADLVDVDAANKIDNFVLDGVDDKDGKPLDDIGGDTRTATITRADGLDGWRVWLADQTTKRRISVLKTLKDVSASVRLDTAVGLNASGGIGLGDDVQAIVAPPESWTAVPSLVTPLPAGQGLKKLAYPSIPPPVTVNGVVAIPSASGSLYGYAARLAFVSKSLTTRATPSTSTLLQYSTSLSTDDRGRFATVLPPGTYDVAIEPALGTGQAKAKVQVDIDRTVTALTLQTPLRPLVHGRATLTDGRALSSADVIALADPSAPADTLTPRPGRAKTGTDGTFALELDPGPYVLTVIPEAGSNFPRVVTPMTVGAESSELPDIHVPAPTRLSFQLRDPSPTGNPIDHAIVSVMANLRGRQGPPIEIGTAMTDADGQVEILLAEEAR